MSNSLFRRKSIENILNEGGDDSHGGGGLKRVLTVRDLTFFGIAAILGAGSFSSLGSAVFNGGPGVVILFIITAIACAFTAFCYSEFASRIPVAGSAYTYAYASFGELFAWIIGWALIMEYSIGNIYVAYSWSGYFVSFLEKLNLHLPIWLTTSYMEAKHALEANATDEKFSAIWNAAPMLGSLRIILDLPALVINMLITYLVYIGVKESRNFSNVMVILKLAVVFLIIAVGGYYVFANGLTSNWLPANDKNIHSFMPNGFSGVMASVASVFFAYIGFDAVSVMAEESKNPQRDLPKSMIYSLVICTVIYILLTFVLSGAVNYKNFNHVDDPLAFIFKAENLNIGWMQFLVSVVAVVAMTSVLLVFQMGQPRIWMSMSRDGLLPNKFQEIHPKHKTPAFATIVTGLVVGVPILFTDKTFVLDFTSIATLFAFVLVCGGVLLIPRKEKVAGKFNLPYVNGKIIFPIMIISSITLISFLFPEYFSNLTKFSLLNETREDATKTFCSDKIADFKDNNMLGNTDKLYLNKILKGKTELKTLLDISGNNDLINKAIELEAYKIHKDGFEKHYSDSIIGYSNNNINLISILDTIKINKDVSTEPIIKLLDAKKDTNLISKLKLQQKIIESYSDNNDSIKKAGIAFWQNGINNAFNKNKISELQSLYDKKTEAQKTLNVSSIIFWLFIIILAIVSFFKKWSLIPILGLASCLYLLTGMTLANWLWFGAWLGLGLIVYFLYGYKKSKLAK